MHAIVRCSFGLLSALAASALLAQSGPTAAGKSAFTADDLVRMKRVSDPQVSPDGRYVAYIDERNGSRRRQASHRPVAHRPHVERRRATPPHAEPRERQQPALVRGQQVHLLPLDALRLVAGVASSARRRRSDAGDGLSARRRLARRWRRSAAASRCRWKCCRTAIRRARRKSSTRRRSPKRPAASTTSCSSVTGTRGATARARISSPTLIGADGKAGAPSTCRSRSTRMCPRSRSAATRNGRSAPTASRIVFTARVAGRTEPWSTNFDRVRSDRPTARRRRQNLTAQQPGVGYAAGVPEERRPRLPRDGSPDLRSRPLPRRASRFARAAIARRSRTSGIARSIASNVAGDGNTLLASTDDIGQHSLFSIDAIEGHAAQDRRHRRQVTEYSAAKDSSSTRSRASARRPDLYVTRMNGSSTRRLTNANQDVLGQRAMSEYEQFSFRGWNDETVYGYVMKPLRLHRRQAISGGVRHSRRSAGALRECVELSLESAGVGRARLRRRVHRLPRLAGLRPEVHGFDQSGLGRQAARRSAEGPRRRAREVRLAGRQQRLRGRRFVRRLHDQLDRGQLARSLQVPRESRRHLRSAHDVLRHAKSCGSTSGRTAGRTSRCRRTSRSSRRRRT